MHGKPDVPLYSVGRHFQFERLLNLQCCILVQYAIKLVRTEARCDSSLALVIQKASGEN